MEAKEKNLYYLHRKQTLLLFTCTKLAGYYNRCVLQYVLNSLLCVISYLHHFILIDNFY